MIKFNEIMPPGDTQGSSAFHGYDDHWLEDPTRDKPMGHRWRMAQDDVTKALRLPKMKTQTQTDILHFVAADMIMTARMHPGRRISYSRSDGFYKSRKQYTPEGYNLANVTAAVDLLEKLGYVTEHDKRPAGRRGTQSSFLPNPSLAMLLLPAVPAPPRDELIMKDSDGNVVSYAEPRRRGDDNGRQGPAFSGRIHDMRQVVRKVNEVLENTEIVLDAEDIVADGPWLRKGDHVMYPALKSLYRVFNGGWRLGGRYYGGWWQGVKSEDRKFFLLDGEKTEEIDYSQIHPRIIYAEAGIDLVGDAYDIPGFDRNLCKAAFNILVNAACFPSALGAVAQEMDGDRKGAEVLIEAIKTKHRDVARYFHSSAGVRLQGLDSRMAEIVLSEMTVKRGIPVLPVHDSFIVPEKYKETLVKVMKDAFERVVGRSKNRDWIVKSSVGNTLVRSEGYSSYGLQLYTSPSDGVPTSPPAAPFTRETAASDSDSEFQPPVFVPSSLSTSSSEPVSPPLLEVLSKPIVRRPAPSFLVRARDAAHTAWIAEEAAKAAKVAARMTRLGLSVPEIDVGRTSGHPDTETVLYETA